MFQKATKYIGVHLDQTLNFKQPMKKLRLRLHILGVNNACLTGTTWGGCSITLRNSTQTLVFSAAWIRVTVWSRTPHVKVDVNINSAILTISGCLKPTHVFQLLVLTGIAMMKVASLILAMKATKHDWHHLHGTTITKRIPTQVPSVMQ